MFKRMLFLGLFYSSLGWSAAPELLDKIVALVNNNVITESELDAQVLLSKKQILAQHMKMPADNVLKKQVLQHLIDVELQLQLAKDRGVTVDKMQVTDAIAGVAKANKLSLDELREVIAKQGMSFDVYKRNFKKEMIIAQVQQKAVSKEVQVTNEQVEDFLKKGAVMNEAADTAYHVQNIVIPVSEEPSTDELTLAQNKARALLKKIKQGEDFSTLAIAESSDEFALEGGDLGERHLAQLPEVFAKEVIHMKAGEVRGPLRTGNGFQLLKLVSKSTQDTHHVVTRTHVRHILLKPAAGMIPSEVKKQVNNIYQQVQGGKDFALMAKQYSLDAASAIKGGDLGWVNPGELVHEFEEAMNKLAPNQISRPVRSQFGWHIIQVLGRDQKDDSEAFKRQQVRHFLQERKFAEAVHNWQQHLRAEAYVKIMDKALA